MGLTPEARRRARADAQAGIDAATDALARGVLGDETWCERVSSVLAAAYLADSDPRWQSGFDGDPAAWRDARELVLDSVARDGTFLDGGCSERSEERRSE